jgi:hypothetical protein
LPYSPELIQMHLHNPFIFLTPQPNGFDRYDPAWKRFACLTMLLGSGLWFYTGVAKAEALPELLLTQQVVDGLPPAPLPPSSQPVTPVPPTGLTDGNTLPSFSSESVRPALPPQLIRPTPQVGTSSIESGYAVYVNGDSPLLLSQVRQVESGAFLQTHGSEQVIQAGLFREEASARQQVTHLESQGIEAEVVEVSRSTMTSSSEVPSSELMATSNAAPMSLAPSPDPADSNQLAATPPSIIFGQQPPALSQNSSGTVNVSSRRSYYVVVPGRSSDLPQISNLITNLSVSLNVSENNNQERPSPLGPHVLVGPFVDRTTASRWNRYLRDFGMDARVYYGR